MPADKDARKYWQKYVEDSKGNSFFLPEQFNLAASQIEKDRSEFNRMLREVVSETELDLQIRTQNLFHELRKYLKKSGKLDIFAKELGWNQEALKAGFLVVNTWEPGPR